MVRWKVQLPLLATSAIAFVWAILATHFSADRGLWCQPLISQRCWKLAWNKLGDFVLLGWLDHWQTLTAGLIAIIAALIGGAYIQSQERERYRRKHAAARAMLPLALSAFTKYATGMAQALRQLYSQVHNGLVPSTATIPEFPPLPLEAIPVFRDLVETSTRKEATLFVNAISRMQILSARTETLREEILRPSFIVSVDNLNEYVCDAAEIYAICGELFPYARHETPIIPTMIGLEGIEGALRIAGFSDDHRYDRLHDRAKRRFAEPTPTLHQRLLTNLRNLNPRPSSARQ